MSAEVKTIDRLAKICGILGSSADGERAAAALLASQVLEDLGLSWRDLVIAAFADKPQPKAVEFDDRQPGWHVGYCSWLIVNKGDSLNEKEMAFLNSLFERYRHVKLTVKQADWLMGICRKYGLEV